MTALAILRTPTAVVVASDGASYDDEGVVRHIGSKMILLSEASSIIVVRGPQFVETFLRRKLEQLSVLSFDAVSVRLPGFAREAHSALATHPDATAHLGFSVYLCGVPMFDDDGPVVEVVRSWEDGIVPAFMAVRSSEDVILAPEPYADIAEAFGVQLPSRNADAWRADPTDFALRVICALRWCPGGPAGSDRVDCCVGGFVEIATVARDTVVSCIAHRWPDFLGEPLDPRKGTPFPLAG